MTIHKSDLPYFDPSILANYDGQGQCENMLFVYTSDSINKKQDQGASFSLGTFYGMEYKKHDEIEAFQIKRAIQQQ